MYCYKFDAHLLNFICMLCKISFQYAGDGMNIESIVQPSQFHISFRIVSWNIALSLTICRVKLVQVQRFIVLCVWIDGELLPLTKAGLWSLISWWPCWPQSQCQEWQGQTYICLLPGTQMGSPYVEQKYFSWKSPTAPLKWCEGRMHETKTLPRLTVLHWNRFWPSTLYPFLSENWHISYANQYIPCLMYRWSNMVYA